MMRCMAHSTWNRTKKGLVLALLIIGTYLIVPSSVYHVTMESELTTQSTVPLPTIRDLAASMPERLTSRNSNLNTICSEFNTTGLAEPRTILYSKIINTAFCPVPAAGSTMLKYGLLQIEGGKIRSSKIYNLSYTNGVHIDAQVLNLPQARLSKPERLSKSGHNTKFLLVARNPWSRLHTYYTSHIKDLTPLCSKFVPERTVMKFEHFVNCLLEDHRVTNGTRYINKYLTPVWRVCSICRVQYNIIVEYDDLLSELSGIFNKRPSEKKFVDHLATFIRENPTLTDYYQFKPTVDDIRGQLPKVLIERVERLYELDFKVFNYPMIT